MIRPTRKSKQFFDKKDTAEKPDGSVPRRKKRDQNDAGETGERRRVRKTTKKK